MLALLGALAIAVGGCVCVVWAERGGPRWVRIVARVTLAVGELVRRSDKSGRGGRNSGDDG
ncbi:hypothetical protein [Streptomyces cavernicola]|uniref:Uncharacterized protein n=1 Tax=Streptomyces cavernicola TaxID=3043613 RepID=A0ABT6SAY4_9ACTN|nr:hypothetical protein [Streptomyces sp. B-S-A6]MDI3405105.1 hypothetical protein [Streptomyces sp. B-S-A6]